MKLPGRKIILFLLFFIPLLGHAQSEGGKPAGGGTQNTSASKPLSRRAQRRADRKKWKEYRKKRKAERKAVKEHHKRIQTKETLKRMKRSKRTAGRNQSHQREFFLKRWFNKG